MKGTFALVGGAGLGAGLMYLLDPDRGDRRRARLNDTLAGAASDAADRFPTVTGVASDAVAAARQAAARFEPPRLVSELAARLDAPRRVAELRDAARRAGELRPVWRDGR